jgi:hypothetical protein
MQDVIRDPTKLLTAGLLGQTISNMVVINIATVPGLLQQGPISSGDVRDVLDRRNLSADKVPADPICPNRIPELSRSWRLFGIQFEMAACFRRYPAEDLWRSVVLT